MALSLDTLSVPDAAVAAAAAARARACRPRAALDDADAVAPALVDGGGAQARRRRSAAARPGSPALFVFGGALALTAYGAYEMYQVVSVSRTTVLQWLLLALFTLNFSWIALAFTSALLGFVVLLRRPAPPGAAAGGAREPHRRRDAGLQRVDGAHLRGARGDPRIRRRDRASGAHFDYFILSDSTNPDAWIAEERAFLALRERARPRQRASTTGTGRRTITARPATSPISSRAGAAPTSTCWCSTPTA